MDKIRFEHVCNQVIHMQRQQSGIGTLSEKTLHAVLKKYFEPNEANHEVKIGRYVADIATENGIIEIQTANFNKLRNKLECFLEGSEVTIVYPIVRTKWLSWIDPETGEISKKRKSPKIGKEYEAFFELYKIKTYLNHPNLNLCIVLFDSEEYRYLNGWSMDKKRGSTRSDRIPTALCYEVMIKSSLDYQKLIPNELIEGFTTLDYKKITGLNIDRARTALHVLNYVGAVERIGKKGNQYIYKRKAEGNLNE